MNPQAVAIALLALLTLLNLVLTLGLARRLRLAHHGGPDETSVQQPFPSAGASIGAFSVASLDGGRLDTESLSNGTVRAAFLSVGCEPCATVKQQLLDRGYVAHPLVVFVVGEADDPMAQEIADDLSPVTDRIAIVDVDSPAVRAFDVRAFPTLVLLTEGVVQRSGWRLQALDPVKAN